MAPQSSETHSGLDLRRGQPHPQLLGSELVPRCQTWAEKPKKASLVLRKIPESQIGRSTMIQMGGIQVFRGQTRQTRLEFCEMG